MPKLRLLPRAALLCCAMALIPVAGASAEMCDDCEPSGGGGTGSTQPIPDTTITDGPQALYVDTTPTFKMKSTLSNVSYRCRITKGNVAGTAYACGTTGTAGLIAEHTLPEQADGSYTMSIAACKEYTGTTTTTKCDGTPATRSYAIDTVRPSLVVSGTSAPVHSPTPPTFTFSSDSPDFKYFRCGIDGASSWVECGPTFSWPADAAEGAHQVYVHSYDHAGNLSGNMERRVWVKDTIKPVVTMSGPSGAINDTTPTFTWSIEDADTELAQRKCILVGYGDGTPVGITLDCPGTSWTPPSPLPDREYELYVQVQDRAGNSSELKSKVFTVDTTAPALSDITWNPTTKRLTYTADDGPLACRFDAGSEFACGTNVDASQLADGEHTLVVTLKDAAGNATTKSLKVKLRR